MPYTVAYLEDHGVVETVYSGTVTLEELQSALTDTGVVAAENLCNRFLIDAREQGGAEGSTFDILKLAEFLSSLPLDVIEREAILPPPTPQTVDDVHFFETAARNRGLNVLMFSDRDEALAWLSE